MCTKRKLSLPVAHIWTDGLARTDGLPQAPVAGTHRATSFTRTTPHNSSGVPCARGENEADSGSVTSEAHVLHCDALLP